MLQLSRWPRWMILLSLAGCGDEPTRDLFSVEGVVRGTVTSRFDGPVPNAWVAIEGGYPLSNGQFEPLYDSVRTDASGRFLGRVGVLNFPDTIALVTVRTWPPAEAGLMPGVEPNRELRITADPQPADTLVVGFVLNPT
jgi:hypothetical protein